MGEIVAGGNIQVDDNYLDLTCPATGEICPSRAQIHKLCNIHFDSANSTIEELELARDDSIKETELLLAHTGLIKAFGCPAGPVDSKCSPSVSANTQPPIRGLKKFIKNRLER